MSLESLLDFLKNSKKARGITAWEYRVPRVPDYRDIPSGIHEDIKAALAARGIQQLYSHQRETIELVTGKRNPVIATPTASGKTLCYNLPVLDMILRNSASRAMYIFPTKALAQDQLHELRIMSEHLGNRILPASYDGDTAQDSRRSIRWNAQILLTNPDMLHAGILPHHTKWSVFFENLKMVVIDELHQYRGVFGSHFCNVIRRLKRICQFYGSDPGFILCSATLANPADLAAGLIDAPAELIKQSGAPEGEKSFIFYNPPLLDPVTGIRRSYLTETIEFARYCLKHDVQTIVFTRSRRNVEIVVRELKRITNDPDEEGVIRGYRGGYLPRERRDIEKNLRNGQIRCVVATSALELGIDIGDLEMVILSGYPGTIAGTWQRAGRSGRREGQSAAVYIASSAPLDQFMVRNPDYFFRSAPEFGLINPDNLLILLDHIRCSIFELPFRPGEQFSILQDTDEFLNYLQEDNDVRQTSGQWFYTGGKYPAEKISLRSISADNYLVCDLSDSNQRTIAEVDGASVFFLAHQEAIYMHGGKQYYVEELDQTRHRVLVREMNADYYTVPLEHSSVLVLETYQSTQDEFPVHMGEVQVTSQVVGYKKLRFHNMENLGGGSLNLPKQELVTTGFWLSLPLDILDLDPMMEFREIAAGLVGALAVMHSTASVILMSDPRDLGSSVGGSRGTWFAQKNPLGTIEISGDASSVNLSAHVDLFIYDRYSGGIGLAESLFDRYDFMIHAAGKLVRECDCSYGCPGCIGPINAPGSSAKNIAQQLIDTIENKIT